LTLSFRKSWRNKVSGLNGEARRISWIGHVERMVSRMPKGVMREKIYTRRKRGKPKVRWLDDVQEDLRVMEIEGGEGKLRIETSGGE
jgi:hypothetical protein